MTEQRASANRAELLADNLSKWFKRMIIGLKHDPDKILDKVCKEVAG